MGEAVWPVGPGAAAGAGDGRRGNSRLATKSPQPRRHTAKDGRLNARHPIRESPTAMRQRLACLLIGSALTLIAALVALLLSDALAPGRVPPMLAFWGAAAAGGLLILGLALLDRGAGGAAEAMRVRGGGGPGLAA